MRRTWRSVMPVVAVTALLGVLSDSAAAAMPDEPSIRVDTNAARSASDANWPSSSGKSWGAHLSERGLGAVYWAVQHPEQAWRILAPIQPRDAAADETSKERAPVDSASRTAGRPLG